MLLWGGVFLLFALFFLKKSVLVHSHNKLSAGTGRPKAGLGVYGNILKNKTHKPGLEVAPVGIDVTLLPPSGFLIKHVS